MGKSNKVLKGFKIAFSSLFYLIIVMLLLFSIATLTRKKETQIPNLFGLGFLSVDEKATSMIGGNKDSFNPGDLVFVKVLNKKQQEKLDFDKMLEKRTVVTFFDYGKKVFNTHRIVDVNTYNVGGEEIPYVITQGDNEINPDDTGLEKGDILAIYKGKLPGFGKAIAYMQTPVGFAVIVIIPMVLLFIWQGYVLVTDIYKIKEDKLKDNLEKQQDEERERIRQELLEEMKKEDK